MILWSYNGQYPVIEIKNCTLAQLYSVEAKENIEQILQGIPSDNNIRELGERLRQNLPLALIKIGIYKPLSGLVTKIDERGVVTNYEYDDFQRLKRVTDNNDALIQRFEYKFKQ